MHVSSSSLVAGMAFVVALFLIGTAVPYGVAFGITQPYREQIAYAQKNPDAPFLDTSFLLPLWQRALMLYPDPRLVSEAAFLQMVKLRRMPDTPATQGEWRDLAETYQNMLSRYPRAPIDWGRLSYAATRAGEGELARVAWEKSVKTGQYVPDFMLWRYAHGLALMDSFTPTQQALLVSQTKILLKKDFWRLAALARLAPFSDKVPSLVCAASPESCEEFLRVSHPLGHTPDDRSGQGG